MAYSLRDYRPDDAPAMARLYYDSVRELGPRAYSLEQVAVWSPAPADPGSVHARASDGRVTVIAADAEDRVAAYGDLEADGHIDHLYVRPDAAGTGIAGAVLDELLARAAAAGMTRLYVEASELAKSLFVRKGFEVVARRDFELRGVMIHNYAMAKEI